MATPWPNHILLTSISLSLGLGTGALLVLALPCRSMTFTWRAEPGHARSFGVHVIDPAGNPTEEETYNLQIPVYRLRPGMRDEEILARFSKGFFAGWVFALERWIAPFVQGVIDHEVITSARVIPQGPSLEPDAYNIDNPACMPRTSLPPLGACLFGLYYLIDTSTCGTEYRRSIFPSSAVVPRPDRSFVEYAGRTSGRSLAASHRFELSRGDLMRSKSKDDGDGEENVTIVYSHVRSNPRTGGQVYSKLMTAMHVVYAHLLFAEGVREVLRP